jgi:hypothetical protein
MTPRPPMPHETPLSPSEAAYLEHDYTLPTTLCQQHYRNSEGGQSLCKLGCERLCTARPVSAWEFEGASQSGIRAAKASEGVANA